MKRYDYLVVGSGLYGAIFAHEAKVKGKSVLVVDKRPNIAGNVYTEKQENKYEQIINSILNLTKEVNLPEELEEFENRYDVYVSGSDQIWSARSCELAFCDWKRFIKPYLLEFTDRKKISYASSPNNMKSDELKEIITDISKFEYVSCREQESSNKLEKMLNRKVETVLDPTLLLYKEEWKKLLHNWRNTYTNEKYIFYYVLKGTRSLNKDLKIICNMAKTRGYKVVTASPLSVVLPNKNIINATKRTITSNKAVAKKVAKKVLGNKGYNSIKKMIKG